ncbi:hypothetical protein AGOR_G00144700 [Albula goreensis]|uniref:Uncharacterized protein n=1 Tax=Albula goreensis TaxID=1534307 RepID=A0A8T3DAB1_9TELE|nr:hypothetical protein AGOR_G00144700 [Albula goreensis]
MVLYSDPGLPLKSLRLREEEAAKEEKKSKNVETSAEKLRKILKEERRRKKKRRRSSSSSSTSSSSSESSSSSSSSGHRKSKKRRRKRRRPSRSRKKRHRRISSRTDMSVESKEEWYPAPANTSASFLSHKQEVVKLLGEQERSEVKGRRSRPSLSCSSVEVLDDSRGRSEDDAFSGTPQEGLSSRGKDRFWDGSSPGRDSRPSEWRCREEARGCWRAEERLSSSEKVRDRKPSSSSAGSEHARRSDRPTKEGSSQSSGCRESTRPAKEGSSLYRESASGRHSRLSSTDQNPGTRASERNEHGMSNRQYRNGQDSSQGSLKKDLPSNLLSIFSQIAQFEKEKCMKLNK